MRAKDIMTSPVVTIGECSQMPVTGCQARITRDAA